MKKLYILLISLTIGAGVSAQNGKLKAPILSGKLKKRLVNGTRKQSKGKSVEKISNIRDKYLLDLLLMRKKYEKKLR